MIVALLMALSSHVGKDKGYKNGYVILEGLIPDEGKNIYLNVIKIRIGKQSHQKAGGIEGVVKAINTHIDNADVCYATGDAVHLIT